MASTGSFRVKIPRNAAGAESASLEPNRPTDHGTDVPGTFITAIPPLPETSMRELEVNAVNPPYSYSRVSYSDRTKEYLYEVIEPQLTAHERSLVLHLKSTLNQILGSETGNLSTSDKRSYLRGEVEEYFRSRGVTLSPLSTERVVYYMLPGLRGLRTGGRPDPRPGGGGHLVRRGRRPAVHLPRKVRVGEDERRLRGRGLAQLVHRHARPALRQVRQRLRADPGRDDPRGPPRPGDVRAGR